MESPQRRYTANRLAHKGDRVPTRRQFLVLSSTAALTGLLPETPASAAEAVAQPYASYWHPATILNWDPVTDRDAKYNRSSVPLARRVVPNRPANAHAHTGEARVQALVAYAPTSNNPAQGALDMNYYATNYWQYIDEIVFWGGSASEGLILAPNPTVTDAAHRNGVRVIGNVFLPPTAYGGQIQWVRDFVRREGDRFPVADKMIQVARHYGFDGWFLNQETAGGNTQLAHGHARLHRLHEEERSAGHLVRRDDRQRFRLLAERPHCA